MAISDADLWHQVHAQREDGVPAMFLIREIDPRTDQPQIVVIELPYPSTEPEKLPDDASQRRLDTFQDQWIEPACEVLGWTFVASKCEDGSFYLYLYGGGDPNALLEKLSPFDQALKFFHEEDAAWSEYAALRGLVEQAEAAPEDDDGEGEDDHVHTDDCDHEHDAEPASPGIPVVDLTGEPPARKPAIARPPTRKPAAKPTAAKAAATKRTAAKAAAKPAAAKRTTAKAAAKPAAAKPTAAKAAATKPTAKPTAAKPTAKPAAAKPTAAKPTAKRAAAKRAARKPVAKPAARKAAVKPAKPRPAAKRATTTRTARRR